MRAKISQREARRLKRQVEELMEREESRLSRWTSDWPGGVCLGSMPRERDWLSGRIEASRMLGHAVVVLEKDGTLKFYAVPLEKTRR